MLDRFIFLLLILSLGVGSYAQGPGNHVALKELTVYGKSNIENFNLKLITTTNNSPETVTCFHSDSAYRFEIPLKYFTSCKKYIEEDFKKLLREEEFPEIWFLISSDQLPKLLRNDNGKVIGELIITGITNKYVVHVEDIQAHDTYGYLKCRIKLRLSDFSIKPVSKLFGMIRVDDEVVIDFKLILPVKVA